MTRKQPTKLQATYRGPVDFDSFFIPLLEPTFRPFSIWCSFRNPHSTVTRTVQKQDDDVESVNAKKYKDFNRQICQFAHVICLQNYIATLHYIFSVIHTAAEATIINVVHCFHVISSAVSYTRQTKTIRRCSPRRRRLVRMKK